MLLLSHVAPVLSRVTNVLLVNRADAFNHTHAGLPKFFSLLFGIGDQLFGAFLRQAPIIHGFGLELVRLQTARVRALVRHVRQKSETPSRLLVDVLYDEIRIELETILRTDREDFVFVRHLDWPLCFGVFHNDDLILKFRCLGFGGASRAAITSSSHRRVLSLGWLRAHAIRAKKKASATSSLSVKS